MTVSHEVVTKLHDIDRCVGQVDELIQRVATGNTEQSRSVAEITAASLQLDVTTQTNAASAEESAAVSEKLSTQAERINQPV